MLCCQGSGARLGQPGLHQQPPGGGRGGGAQAEGHGYPEVNIILQILVTLRKLTLKAESV